MFLRKCRITRKRKKRLNCSKNRDDSRNKNFYDDYEIIANKNFNDYYNRLVDAIDKRIANLVYFLLASLGGLFYVINEEKLYSKNNSLHIFFFLSSLLLLINLLIFIFNFKKLKKEFKLEKKKLLFCIVILLCVILLCVILLCLIFVIYVERELFLKNLSENLSFVLSNRRLCFLLVISVILSLALIASLVAYIYFLRRGHPSKKDVDAVGDFLSSLHILLPGSILLFAFIIIPGGGIDALLGVWEIWFHGSKSPSTNVSAPSTSKLTPPHNDQHVMTPEDLQSIVLQTLATVAVQQSAVNTPPSPTTSPATSKVIPKQPKHHPVKEHAATRP